jgi:plastocyanin
LKRLLYLATLFMAAMLICAPAASAQDEMSVSIQHFFFDPDQLSVAPGTTVTWVNEGQAPHTVTSTEQRSSTLPPYSPATLTPSPSMKVMRARPTHISARSIPR